MTKNDLIRELAVSERLLYSTASKAVDGVIRILKESLRNGQFVHLRGFGTLTVNHCKERPAQHFSTGEPIIIPAHRTVRFNPSFEFKESLNSPNQ